MNIKNEVLDVLGNATTEGHSLKLNGQLSRTLYVDVNKVLEIAGGKWSRKLKAHLFDGDAAETMEQIILTGQITDKKNELGYFPTPTEVVERIMKAAQIGSEMLVLEPSAGRGAIAFEALKYTKLVDCYEIDHDNADFLVFSKGTHAVVEADFLTVEPKSIYDRVVMNPPFAKNIAPAHVLHALAFLKTGGRLVSVMPSGITFRTDKINSILRGIIENKGNIEELPEKSFVESGTSVNTVMVTIDN